VPHESKGAILADDVSATFVQRFNFNLLIYTRVQRWV
jgi:hypothetical protein